jgi:hypothetical protein
LLGSKESELQRKRTPKKANSKESELQRKRTPKKANSKESEQGGDISVPTLFRSWL